MTRISLIFILLLAGTALYGQVSISAAPSTPDPSAMLDVQSTNSGMLVPRMTTTQRNGIASPAEGLLVYDNTTGSFWYYDDNEWTELLNGKVTEMWDDDEDTGIEVEAGTDDDIIRLHLGGTEQYTFTGGRIEMNNLSNSVIIGEKAGRSDDSTNNKNVLIGNEAGRDLLDAYHNVAIGYRSMQKRQTGHSNTAVGELSLQENTDGIYNTAYGVHAGRVNTKNYNTFLGALVMDVDTGGFQNTIVGALAMMGARNASRNATLGFEAMRYNTEGDDNVAIGWGAGRNYTGNKSVMIGFNAGKNETNGQRLYIESSNSTTPLIYGEFDNDIVRINGDLQSTGEIIAYDGDQAMTIRSNAANNYVQFDVGGTGHSSDAIYLGDLTNATNPVYMMGQVGIGTTSQMNAKLNVAAVSGRSIDADGSINANAFKTQSDERIKRIKGRSDGADDLATLMGIEITDYQLRDSRSYGDQTVKKVIAQQVKEVYPQAVESSTTRAVPDIYATASIKDGWIVLENKLHSGDMVKLIYKNSEKTVKVIEANEKAFRVEATEEGPVFVYGKEVSDFHTVDYDALSMLNISATQSLYRDFQNMKSELDELKAAIEEIQTIRASLENR